MCTCGVFSKTWMMTALNMHPVHLLSRQTLFINTLAHSVQCNLPRTVCLSVAILFSGDIQKTRHSLNRVCLENQCLYSRMALNG